MIKLNEIYKTAKGFNPKRERVDVTYGLRELYVNPSHIVLARENEELRHANAESSIIDDLSPEARFSEVIISSQGQSSRIVDVVASPSQIAHLCRGE